MAIVRMFFDGWATILGVFWKLLLQLLYALRALIRRDKEDGRRDFREVACIPIPPDIRARPDPFIYSQQWLRMRGLAVTWDNPDFRLLDAHTGDPVERFDLKPDADYTIEATIHNNSFMAAINTTVRFEVRRFGAGTSLLSDLGAVTIDVPAAGTTVARIKWQTPETGGHNCLLAIIEHEDDANPLNNVGQHNTDIARSASPKRQLHFHVGNQGNAPRVVHLRMDGYRLPKRGNCAKDFQGRQTIDHLRRLQAEHNVDKAPVPGYLAAELSALQLRLEPAEERAVTLTLKPPPAGSGMQAVNVNAYVGDHLIGGVTAYILEEGD